LQKSLLFPETLQHPCSSSIQSWPGNLIRGVIPATSGTHTFIIQLFISSFLFMLFIIISAPCPTRERAWPQPGHRWGNAERERGEWRVIVHRVSRHSSNKGLIVASQTPDAFFSVTPSRSPRVFLAFFTKEDSRRRQPGKTQGENHQPLLLAPLPGDHHRRTQQLCTYGVSSAVGHPPK
jgi:hypothetical protein